MASPQRNAVVPPPDAPSAEYSIDIPVEKYRNRTYYAARDAVNARDGVLRGLRAALTKAEKDGRTVTISITIK